MSGLLGVLFWNVPQESVCGEVVFLSIKCLHRPGQPTRKIHRIRYNLFKEPGPMGQFSRSLKGVGALDAMRTPSKIWSLNLLNSLKSVFSRPERERCSSEQAAQELFRLRGVWEQATAEENKHNPFRFIQMRLEDAKVKVQQEALDASNKIALESVSESNAVDTVLDRSDSQRAQLLEQKAEHKNPPGAAGVYSN